MHLKDKGADAAVRWSACLEAAGAAHRCETASFSSRSLRVFRRHSSRGTIFVGISGVVMLLLLSLTGLSQRPGPREEVLHLPETLASCALSATAG